MKACCCRALKHLSRSSNKIKWLVDGAPSKVLALSLTLSLTAGAAHSNTLIRCPDWKQLSETQRIYGVRKSAPSQSFDAVINASAERPLVSAPWNPFTKKPKTASSGAGTTCTPHTVKSGDTLSKIAKARLGSVKQYREIAAANKINVTTPLKIGQKLLIPCTPGDTVGTALAKTSPLPSSKVVVPVKVAAPLPVWKAKSGEYLTDTLRRWGKTAGYKVLKEGADDWRISVPVTVMGTFEEATAQLVRGFEGTGRPPGVSIYSNKVVKVGAP